MLSAFLAASDLAATLDRLAAAYLAIRSRWLVGLRLPLAWKQCLGMLALAACLWPASARVESAWSWQNWLTQPAADAVAPAPALDMPAAAELPPQAEPASEPQPQPARLRMAEQPPDPARFSWRGLAFAAWAAGVAGMALFAVISHPRCPRLLTFSCPLPATFLNSARNLKLH